MVTSPNITATFSLDCPTQPNSWFSLVPMEEIERLMLTRRYWAVVADTRNVEVLTMASAELDDAKARWDFEFAELAGC